MDTDSPPKVRINSSWTFRHTQGSLAKRQREAAIDVAVETATRSGNGFAVNSEQKKQKKLLLVLSLREDE